MLTEKHKHNIAMNTAVRIIVEPWMISHKLSESERENNRQKFERLCNQFDRATSESELSEIARNIYNKMDKFLQGNVVDLAEQFKRDWTEDVYLKIVNATPDNLLSQVVGHNYRKAFSLGML